MQDDVEIGANGVTGTLKFIEGGLAESGPLAGDGYFLALTLADNTYTGLASVKVGLEPSAGTGLVELIDDPDKNGVFKVTNKDVQKFKVVQTASDGRTKTQIVNLDRLELESAEGA